MNSGNGVHAYWLLEEMLPRKEWEPLAKRLKQLCKEHDLIVDDKVFEASRVLRVPESMNVKKGLEPKPVSVWNEVSPRLSVEKLRELLGAPEPNKNKKRKCPTSYPLP